MLFISYIYVLFMLYEYKNTYTCMYETCRPFVTRPKGKSMTSIKVVTPASASGVSNVAEI
jgi:hypothetical protein